MNEEQINPYPGVRGVLSPGGQILLQSQSGCGESKHHPHDNPPPPRVLNLHPEPSSFGPERTGGSEAAALSCLEPRPACLITGDIRQLETVWVAPGQDVEVFEIPDI